MDFLNLNKTTHFAADMHTVHTEILVSIFDGDNEPYVANLRSFKKEIITFGRSPDNDIVLHSKLVSRYHGYFKITSSGCHIFDKDSTNGLIVNGCRQTGEFVCDGDRIRIDDPNVPTEKGVLILFETVNSQFQWNYFEIKDKQAITIGRDASCDIRLDHASVSKIHARIVKEDDKYFLIDNNSTNGISIAGSKVTNKIQLMEKDLILITNSKLTFTRQRISYHCHTTGFGLDAVDLVRTVKGKDGPRNICNHISLSIRPCEFAAIIGGSGAGKSTFMNCISGYVKADSGLAIVNGENLYDSYETMKSIIGYVPQKDIVYDNLTLVDMLTYSAKLRMPKDTTDNERSVRINTVIKAVELDGHENTFIRQLSGGQKKRASIAVELLSDPNLFFLDEPTSGLDPGTERNLMYTLRNMTRAGKTIVLVTHNTLNLHLCDKIIFLGKGGNLCFCGSYDDALKFFEVDSLVNVYNMLTENSLEWKDKYIKSPYVSSPQFSAATHEGKKISASNKMANLRHYQLITQLVVLSKRYTKLLLNDRQRMFLLILQAPLLAILISLVVDGQEFVQYEMTKSILFALSCAAFWIGIMNTIQEVCKERVILKREYMTGLLLPAYIGSKMIVMAVISAIQASLLLGTFSILVGIPNKGIIMPSFVEMYITTFIAIFSAAGMGIFVSSLFKNPERAMTIAPIMVLPQIIYSGIIFKLSDAAEKISNIVACRWSMESYGSIANLNELPYKAQQEGLTLMIRETESFFERTSNHLIFTWAVLLGIVVMYSLFSTMILRSIKRD